MAKPKLPPWKKLKRITACLVVGTNEKNLEESLLDAAKEDPKWAVYAGKVAEYRDFLRSVFQDNRELLESQFDAGMRDRARGMSDDEVVAAVRSGTL